MPIESSLHAEDGQPEDRSLPSTSSAIDDTSKNVLLGDTLTGSAALSAVESGAEQSGAWRERREAEKLAEGWLRESPSGFILVTGPSGSGKTALVQQVIDAENKYVVGVYFHTYRYTNLLLSFPLLLIPLE